MKAERFAGTEADGRTRKESPLLDVGEVESGVSGLNARAPIPGFPGLTPRPDLE